MTRRGLGAWVSGRGNLQKAVSETLPVMELTAPTSGRGPDPRLGRLLGNLDAQSLRSCTSQEGGFQQVTVTHWKIQTAEGAQAGREIPDALPCIQRLPGASSVPSSLQVAEVAPTAGHAPSSGRSCLPAEAQVPPLIWLMTHHESRPIPSCVLGSARYPSAASDPRWPFASLLFLL